MGTPMHDGAPVRGRILVAEDDAAIRRAVAQSLEDEGYGVLEAADGLEALGLLDRRGVDLLILDLWMPRLDGPGLVRMLRRRGVRVPILVLTASREALGHAAELEADGWIGKPFELEELLAKVARLLGPPIA